MRQQEDAARGCGKQQEVAGSSRKQYVLSTTKHTKHSWHRHSRHSRHNRLNSSTQQQASKDGE